MPGSHRRRKPLILPGIASDLNVSDRAVQLTFSAFVFTVGPAQLLYGPLADRLGLSYDESREFGTAAGYALSVLKHLPVEGERFVDQGWEIEIIDMDRRRIDKMLARKSVSEEA